MYEIMITCDAEADLNKLPFRSWQRMQDLFNFLSDQPRPSNVIRLQGGAYRLDNGHYKVLYDIHDDKRVIKVLRVKPITDALEAE